MIRAAYVRGVPIVTIARALGMTHQRVDQIVAPIKIYVSERPRFKPGVARTFRVCRQCGQPCEDTSAAIHNGHSYCSRRCHGLAQRALNDADVEAAIDLRVLRRMSWTGIAAVAGVSFQCVQTRIWRYLHLRGELTANRVSEIWVLPYGAGDSGSSPNWNWLVNSTGIEPRETHDLALPKPPPPPQTPKPPPPPPSAAQRPLKAISVAEFRRRQALRAAAARAAQGGRQ